LEMSRRRASSTKTNGHVKARTQPRVVGVRRLPVNSAFAKELETAIADEMVNYNVSRSWVIASCCAYALGIDVPDYRGDDKKKK
jgi:hypothetical protein